MAKELSRTALMIRDRQLSKMGVSLAEYQEWFKRTYRKDYRINGVGGGGQKVSLMETIKLILQFRNKKIRCVTDYDVDGICSSVILSLFLQRLGCRDFKVRIPRRKEEGYGIDIGIVDELRDGEKDCSGTLIITADNGIAAVEAVAYAKSFGMTVIVTDHHLPRVEGGRTILPQADITIDPAAIPGTAVFNGYCGAGLCYKLAEACFAQEKGFMTLLMGFAAIATKADSVPLREENYVICHNGMTALTKKMTLPGLLKLMSRNYISNVTSHEIDFKIAPCINAPGRLDDYGPQLVVSAFLENDRLKIDEYIEEIYEMNKKRKEDTAAVYNEAVRILEEEGYQEGMPAVVYVPEANEGLMGLAAIRIADNYHCCAMVLTDSAESGILKGSARAYGDEAHLKNSLDRFGDLFESYGGHKGAAGVTVRKDNLDAVKREFRRNLPVCARTVKEPEIVIDNKDIADAAYILSVLEPFGECNERPLFRVNNFQVLPRNGKFKDIMKGGTVKLVSSESEAIGFGMEERLEEYPAPKSVDLIGNIYLEYSYKEKKMVPHIEFIDFEIHKTETGNRRIIKKNAT